MKVEKLMIIVNTILLSVLLIVAIYTVYNDVYFTGIKTDSRGRNGAVIEKTQYKDGLKHGISVNWDLDQQLYCVLFYDKGDRHGMMVKFTDDKPTKVLNYVHGKLVSKKYLWTNEEQQEVMKTLLEYDIVNSQ